MSAFENCSFPCDLFQVSNHAKACSNVFDVVYWSLKLKSTLKNEFPIFSK